MHPLFRERRRLAAALCLLAVLAAEARSGRWRELRGRARGLAAFVSMPSGEARLHGSAFAAFRELGPFLRGVAAATPPGATIAVSFASESGDRATYIAAFELAPRRVVAFARRGEADFAAVFRGPGDAAAADARLAARGPSVPLGELVRLR